MNQLKKKYKELYDFEIYRRHNLMMLMRYGLPYLRDIETICDKLPQHLKHFIRSRVGGLMELDVYFSDGHIQKLKKYGYVGDDDKDTSTIDVMNVELLGILVIYLMEILRVFGNPSIDENGIYLDVDDTVSLMTIEKLDHYVEIANQKRRFIEAFEYISSTQIENESLQSIELHVNTKSGKRQPKTD